MLEPILKFHDHQFDSSTKKLKLKILEKNNKKTHWKL